jgi:hypothetical protein
MKFFIVKPSPLPILIPLGPKYSPQFRFFFNKPKISQGLESLLEDLQTFNS